MLTKNTRLYSFILVLVDFFILMAVFSIAYIVRVQYDPRPLLVPIYAIDYLLTFLAIAPLWILVFASLGLYSPSVYERRLTEWARIAMGAFIGILIVIGWEYVSGEHVFPARLVAVYSLVGSFAALVLGRELLRGLRGYLYRYGYGVTRVLVIGNSEATTDIATSLADTKRSGYEVVAVACPAKVFPDRLEAQRFSSADQAIKQLNELRIGTIIQTDLYESEEHNRRILYAAQSRHMGYHFIPGESAFYTGKQTADVFLGYPMITIHQTPLTGWGSIAKRIFDFFASLLLVIVLSPVFLLLIICQKIFNPGPVFYISKRLSRFSEPINLIKFRSMSAKYGSKDAAEDFRDMGREDLALEYETNRKVANDPRITGFGKFLRNTSLDELPQVFNVIKGDLSLVGPRPILPQEVKFSPRKTALLHSVKSGVTGLWQVSGRSNLSFDERIELELYYVQNWSFWRDIKILFKTIGVVLRKTGAK